MKRLTNERFDNKLPTSQELEQMDGEPVWNETIQKWVLVDLQ